jgi:ABC-type branched-subunit amino acid transport system substrate-binding protein
MMIVRRVTIAVILSGALAPRIIPQGVSPHTSLRIGLVTTGGADASPGAASIARGIRLGAAESKQTAALFGDNIELYEAVGVGAAALTAAELLSFARQVQVLIGVSADDADVLSQFAESHHILFFNAASRSQPLRAACRRYTFHVEGTDAMYSNAALAASRWPTTISANTARRLVDSRTDSVALWGPSLQRYGASQLNDRYRDKYQSEMDGFAWAGWAAVKIAAEAALRTRSTSPAKLLAYLESPATKFDGHKGWALTFTAADHQLRQPLYIATMQGAGGYKFRDIPELRDNSSAGAASNAGRLTPYGTLDSLMASPGARPCKWRSR